jgi:hypothetical protein
MDPRSVLDALEKRKIPSPRRESNPRTPIVHTVAQPMDLTEQNVRMWTGFAWLRTESMTSWTFRLHGVGWSDIPHAPRASESGHSQLSKSVRRVSCTLTRDKRTHTGSLFVELYDSRPSPVLTQTHDGLHGAVSPSALCLPKLLFSRGPSFPTSELY